MIWHMHHHPYEDLQGSNPIRKGACMPRPKRPDNPMLQVARTHLLTLAPELWNARIHLLQLDGPPGSPRFAVSADMCCSIGSCSHHITDPNTCPVFACSQRRAIRILLSRKGDLIHVISDHLRWRK